MRHSYRGHSSKSFLTKRSISLYIIKEIQISIFSSAVPFPNSLQLLNCSNNKLTRLPTLPNTLNGLNCSNNRLTSLPDLPNYLQTCEHEIGLRELDCWNKKLTILPHLPNTLQKLYCNSTILIILPNLPDSLQNVNYQYINRCLMCKCSIIRETSYCNWKCKLKNLFNKRFCNLF